jgi:hypothetical protein
LFTTNGATARKFTNEIDVGQVIFWEQEQIHLRFPSN